MSKVAMFTTYAPSEGFGGPARAYHQRRVLEAAGHPVTHVVLQPNPDHGATRRTDFVELVERPYRATVDHIYNDVDLATRAAGDPRLVRRITDHLQRQHVQLIILEQPFLVELVTAVAGALRVPVVYSCQNIEYRLRRDLERFAPDGGRDQRRSEHVRELEVAAVELSAGITAICPTDQQQILDEFGRESTLVPNGSSVAESTLSPPRARRDRQGYFAFAGSSYWPNVEGFVEIATPSLAFLPPTTVIEIAGSCGPEIFRVRSIDRHQSINASRTVQRGFLRMDDLIEMMFGSRAVLVPVFIGEGSNLKSADALASGSPVIMTRRATRGYEDLLELDDEGVTVVDTAEEFRTEIAREAATARPSGVVGALRRSRLAWADRLEPLVCVVDAAIAQEVRP
jgi:hypothetical protein